MRKTEIRTVEKEVTIYSCDMCGHSTESNSGCCGHSPIMKCYFCNQDCCKDHRKSYWENEWEDRPDMTICSDCVPKGAKAWEIALETAGRYDDIAETAKKIFENFEDYDNE